jgi:hypothetical protein
MVKSGSLAIVEWLVRLFNVCMNMDNARRLEKCICSALFKGKGGKKECKNYRVIIKFTYHAWKSVRKSADRESK